MAASTFKHEGDSLIVAMVATKSCHIGALSTEDMLQKFTNTRPYAQPLSPIAANGECFALPSDFVDGLAFLRPLVKPSCKDFEKQVGLLAGKLFVLTTSLVVEYDAGSLELPDFWFSPDVIRTLEAFEAPPTELFVHRTDLCFRWQDEQEFFVRLHNLMSGSTHRQMVDEAFTHYQPFTQGVEVTNTTRRELLRMHGDKKLAADLFINGQSVASRMSSDGKTWTLESTVPFLTNATRIMRFDRHAFLNMIRVADEIDFSVSPVCFRHAHGKGLLIERTATLDTPEMGQFDE